MAKTAALRVVDTEGDKTIVVHPINLVELKLKLVGTAPLVMNAFSEKARNQLMTQMSTPQSGRKSKSSRPPRDYDAEFIAAHHFALGDEGWAGIPANGFRAACISGCRLAGVMMTRAKQALFLVADGWDRVDGQGLVRLEAPPPEKTIMHVRNKMGMTSVIDLRCRPLWREGWKAVITVRYDADFMSAEQVINLVNRGGTQVGICEGRPGSPNSFGMGWGTFAIEGAVSTEKMAAVDPQRILQMIEPKALQEHPNVFDGDGRHVE